MLRPVKENNEELFKQISMLQTDLLRSKDLVYKLRKTLTDIKETSPESSELNLKIKAVTNEVDTLVKSEESSEEQLSPNVVSVSKEVEDIALQAWNKAQEALSLQKDKEKEAKKAVSDVNEQITQLQVTLAEKEKQLEKELKLLHVRQVSELSTKLAINSDDNDLDKIRKEIDKLREDFDKKVQQRNIASLNLMDFASHTLLVWKRYSRQVKH